jgi:hypothetical protein
MGPGVPSSARLVVYDSAAGSEIANGIVEETAEPPTDVERGSQYIIDHLQDLQARLGTHNQRRTDLLGGGPPWTAYDFLYFSIITQTTVGYGDILPNCTRVRKLVTAQVLIGLFLLAVFINVTIKNK